MAKGGGKRTYVRDGRGRFASTPGGAAKKAAKSTSGRASTLAARTSLRRSRAKAKTKDLTDDRLTTALSTRAQKAAVTRGSRSLRAAKAASKQQLPAQRRQGTLSKSKAKRVARASATPANNTRKTGGALRSASAANSARPFSSMATQRGKMRRQAERKKKDQQKQFDDRVLRAGAVNRKAKENVNRLTSKKRLSAVDKTELRKAQRALNTSQSAMRTYATPKSKIVKYKPRGLGSIVNSMDRTIKSADQVLKNLQKKLAPNEKKLERMNARSIVEGKQKGLIGRIARAEIGIMGAKPGMKAIRRRAARAADAAARGSKLAARAREIYGTQMAGMGPGKTPGANIIKPGPRNKNQPPPRKRRTRKPKPRS